MPPRSGRTKIRYFRRAAVASMKKAPGMNRGHLNKNTKFWPASPRSAACPNCGSHPASQSRSQRDPDNQFTCITCHGDLKPTSTAPGFRYSVRQNSRSAYPFKRYLPGLPQLRLPHGATRARVAGSHVIRRGQCLARWLHASNYLRFSPSPNRFSAAQDSKTARLPLIHFIASGLTDQRSATRITLRKRLQETPHLLKLSSEACGLRHTRPGAPVLPCTPDVSRRPQQPTARHRLYRRRHPLGGIDYPHSHRQDIGAFPPRVRVRIARTSLQFS
jgi:hypothetical protein